VDATTTLIGSLSPPTVAEAGGTHICEEADGGGCGHCDADSSGAKHVAHTQHGGGGGNEGNGNCDGS
jgi:hypothetical protein